MLDWQTSPGEHKCERFPEDVEPIPVLIGAHEVTDIPFIELVVSWGIRLGGGDSCAGTAIVSSEDSTAMSRRTERQNYSLD